MVAWQPGTEQPSRLAPELANAASTPSARHRLAIGAVARLRPSGCHREAGLDKCQ